MTHPTDSEVRELLVYIADTPELLSLLYDMDLMPEQVTEGSVNWTRMLLLARAWREKR